MTPMAAVTLEMLGQLVQRVLDNQRTHDDKLKEVVSRLSQLEHTHASLHRDNSLVVENMAVLNERMDRMSDRIERIERRLELVS